MKKEQITTVVFFSVMFVVLACSPKSTPDVASNTSPISQAAPALAKEKWEGEWGSLVKAAQKEGRVIAYMSVGGAFRDALVNGFEARYGIKVEAMAGRDALERLQAERRAGIYLADVYRAGASPMVTVMKPQGMLDPLEPALVLPEVVDPKMWWNGKFPWVDSDRKIVSFVAMASAPIAINTDLVKPGEIKSYRDLINPKWKGKMMMDDPIIAGKGQQLSVIAESITGWDFLSELAKQSPIIMRDRRLHAEWLARGKYPISIQPDTTSTNEFIRVGAPVAFLMPVEGSYLSGACFGLINRATHPNAARVFINWVLTKEAGTLMSKATGQQSARVDVPTDFLEPVTVRQPGVNYVTSYDEDTTLKQEKQMKRLKDIFGDLIK